MNGIVLPVQERQTESTPTIQSAPAKLSWTLLFLFFSLLSSWTVWLFPYEKQGLFSIVALGLRLDFPFRLFKLLLGNCIPGVLALVWALAEGRAEFRQLVSRLAKWRVPFRWYLLALALPIGVFWISLGGISLCVPATRTLPSPAIAVKGFFLTLPFAPLWEELAWRGYALKRLESRFTQLTSALLLGAYWVLWHIPLWLKTHSFVGEMAKLSFLVGAITIFAWSIVFAFLYNRSGESLLVVILLHATYLAVSGEIYRAVQVGQFAFVVLVGVFSVCLSIVCAQRMGRPEPTL